MVQVMGAPSCADADTSSDWECLSSSQNWSLYMDTMLFLCIRYLLVQSYPASRIIIYCLACRECLCTFRQLDSYLMRRWDSLAVLILPWTRSVNPAQTGVLTWILWYVDYVHLYCSVKTLKIYLPIVHYFPPNKIHTDTVIHRCLHFVHREGVGVSSYFQRR